MSMDSSSTPPHVTVTILDVSLSLVHIPRSRLTELSRPILKQLLRKSPKFLNLTANEIELSIFAEDAELDDFEPIARKDRQKQRLRDKSDSKSSWSRRKRLSRPNDSSQSVEISFEKWRVLQIDSHEDSLSNSGSRVRELSAPLAAAGISILYQSSYLSDFIFVKASRLAEVMQLLDAAGFSLDNPDPLDTASSPFPDGCNDKSFAQLQDDANGCGRSLPGSPGSMSPAVLSRTRSPSMASLAALSYAMSRGGSYADLSTPVMTMHKSKLSESTPNSSATSLVARTPKKSLSPTAAPVEVLTPDLACIGLNESAADFWTLKILTLVGYPELIPSSSATSTPSSSFTPYEERRNSLAGSLFGFHPRVRHASPESGRLTPDADFDDAPEEPVWSKPFSAPGQYSDDPSLQDSSSLTSLSSCSSSDEEEYFSSSSLYIRSRERVGSTPSLVSTTSSARSLPVQLDLHRMPARPMLNHMTSSATPTRLPRRLSVDNYQPELSHAVGTRRGSIGMSENRATQRVPFFSFTRTSEGSSLTTDLGVLAALFAHDERHMVICSGSLLDAGDELNERAADEVYSGGRRAQPIFDLESEDDLFEMEEEDESAPGTMKCLQIDLQKFGLEKHGLVNRFSRVLEENGINHMYSSTYKTANLLVDKANAVRAQSLLRSC
ncbi:hypothetical protein DFH11DRAFT_1567513 [Phellopilus nigrolimitatus]|nr:hypothetical protein DFH11DRAFT_1567513 [Phellopilus nigrolimitatus]